MVSTDQHHRKACCHRRNNRGDRGRLVPKLLGWGDQQSCIGPPTFCCLLGYTRPWEPTNERRSHQNAVQLTVASEFSKKKIPGVIPRTPTAGCTHPQPGLRPGAKRPGVGSQTLVPLNFSAVVAPMPAAHSVTSFTPHPHSPKYMYSTESCMER